MLITGPIFVTVIICKNIVGHPVSVIIGKNIVGHNVFVVIGNIVGHPVPVSVIIVRILWETLYLLALVGIL